MFKKKNQTKNTHDPLVQCTSLVPNYLLLKLMPSQSLPLATECILNTEFTVFLPKSKFVLQIDFCNYDKANSSVTFCINRS